MILKKYLNPPGIIIISLILLAPKSQGQKYTVVPADKATYEKNRMGIVYTQKKSRTDWYYELQGGYITREKFKEKINTYDSRGRIHETTFLTRSGIKKSIALYTYRSDDLPVEINEFSPTGEQLSKVMYHYNNSNYLTEIVEYKGHEQVVGKIIFRIDEEKLSVTERRYFSPDSISYRKVYHYSDLNSGFVIMVEEFHGEDQFTNSYTIERGEKNRIEYRTYYTQKGELEYYLKYFYNPKGKLNYTEKLYDNGKRVKAAEYNYSSLLLLTGDINYNHLGEIVKYYKYVYD